MTNRWKSSDIKGQNLIKGPNGIYRKVSSAPVKKKKKVKYKPQAKVNVDPKPFIKFALIAFTKRTGIEHQDEYKFLEDRNFRADHAIPSKRILCEYEGLQSERSGHTTLLGYTKDTEKYKLASQAGWEIWRYTVLNFTSIVDDLNKIPL